MFKVKISSDEWNSRLFYLSQSYTVERLVKHAVSVARHSCKLVQIILDSISQPVCRHTTVHRETQQRVSLASPPPKKREQAKIWKNIEKKENKSVNLQIHRCRIVCLKIWNDMQDKPSTTTILNVWIKWCLWRNVQIYIYCIYLFHLITLFNCSFHFF